MPVSYLSIFPLLLSAGLQARDRILFYGAVLCTAFIAGLLALQGSPGLISGLSFCLAVLLSAYALGMSSGGRALPPDQEVFFPSLLALFLMILSLSGHHEITLEYQAGVMAISMLLLSLSRPFGATVLLSVAVPFGLGMLALIYESASPASMVLAFIIYLALCAYLFLSKVDYVPEDAESRSQRMKQMQSECDRLQAELIRREQSFERDIEEQTKYLRDANNELSQQIALRKTISDALVKSQTRLTQAIDASHLGLIDWDIVAGQFYQSAFHEQFGDKEQSSAQVIETLKAVVHPDDYPEVRDTINACLRGELESYSLRYRVHNADDWLWIEECCKAVDVGADGRADRILGTRRNIQNEMKRDEQVRLAKSVFDHTSEGVFVLDNDGAYLSVNPAYARIMGCDADRLVGKLIHSLSQTPQRQEIYQRIYQTLREQGSWHGELLEKRLSGDYFPQWTQINAITDSHGEIKYFAGMVADISDRKKQDEKLTYLLNYDDLTKLANRVQFQDQLHRALMRYKDEQRPFALVLLDIDRFKQFNDSFGHDASDKLLRDIAVRLTGSVQKVDILARVGGNEFACIVECSPTFEVEKFAQRLFKAVTTAHYEIDGHEVMLSCSVGVVLVPEDTQDIETLMRYGALAVQKAKYHGGNQIQRFHESLKSFSRRRLEMEHELRKALSNDELEVYYQPKLDIKQGRITSYEALIRWVHPSLGVISPEEFVNIAEENGLITDLGAFVLERACSQTQSWMQDGYGKLHVSVNLSARQLKEPGFTALVANTVENTALPAECLELELTESVIMEDTSSAFELLKTLREQGIKISIDDFGTGYSSLSYLKELPVDTLKIDRAFVDGMEASPEQQAIVKAIVVLGNSLRLQVVAEGVEKPQQLNMLAEYGCDLIQGYHVSKPLTAAEMQALLAQQSSQGPLAAP